MSTPEPTEEQRAAAERSAALLRLVIADVKRRIAAGESPESVRARYLSESAEHAAS